MNLTLDKLTQKACLLAALEGISGKNLEIAAKWFGIYRQSSTILSRDVHDRSGNRTRNMEIKMDTDADLRSRIGEAIDTLFGDE